MKIQMKSISMLLCSSSEKNIRKYTLLFSEEITQSIPGPVEMVYYKNRFKEQPKKRWRNSMINKKQVLLVDRTQRDISRLRNKYVTGSNSQSHMPMTPHTSFGSDFASS